MMRLVAGGAFLMGSDDHYPEEAPARRVAVDGFWIDETPVTNAQFQRFVEETGYTTFAERAPDPVDYPGISSAMLRAGSLVFVTPDGPGPYVDATDWWSYSFGADWRRPFGLDSSIDRLVDHPVVHIAYADAEAYAAWAGKALPTEAEWEFAARGGLEAQPYAWGRELAPGGRRMAKYWQGAFPSENACVDGFERTSPVGRFPPNGYGLFDMIGNVWEWTCDWFVDRGKWMPNVSPCCVPRNPRGGAEEESFDPATPDFRLGRKVLKGGSHLCADSYCRRYRPAARYPQPIDTSTSHVGFRCVTRVKS